VRSTVSRHPLFIAALGLGLACTTLAGCSTKTKGNCPKSPTSASEGLAPPAAPVSCAQACDYFAHCQSARWTAPDEIKELRERCAKDCTEGKPGSQEETFFGGLKTCAVGKACVPFGECMRKVLMELRKGSAGGEEPVEDPTAVYKVPVGDAPTQGPADAPVTIVMFADYECGFCAKGWTTMKQLQTAYGAKLRVAYRHYPLPNHAEGRVAALAAACVLKQKGAAAFWKFHDEAFGGKGLGEADLARMAKTAGLDEAALKPCLTGPDASNAIKADLAIGTALGVDGTPAFYVNGRKVAGAQPLDEFKKLVDEGLAKAEAAIKGGVKPADVYEHLIKDGATKPVYLKGKDGPQTQAPEGPPELDPTATFHVPVSKNHPTRGPADALLTVVVFADFQCPACSMASQRLAQLLKDYPKDVRLVYRNAPLENHTDAPLAAEAALAVRAQKGDAGFFAYHDKLYATQQDLTRPTLEKLAEEVGVDLARFKKALDEHTFKPLVDQDMAFALQMGLMARPALYWNGKVMLGVPRSYEDLKKRVDEEIAAAKKRVAAGTAAKDLYDAIIKDGLTKGKFVEPAGGGAPVPPPPGGEPVPPPAPPAPRK
jgi:protein-disulfide isomerase